MKKSFKWASAFLAVLLIFMVAGCNKGEDAGSNGGGSGNKSGEESYNISVVLKASSSPYWKYVTAGAKAAGEELGVNVTVVGPASESEIIQQVNMIEDQLSQNPDALVLAPIQPETIVSVLEGKNLPMLTIDTDANFKGKLSFIGSDNYAAGRKAGELISEQLQAGDKVAIITGALGNPAMDDRKKGAREVFEENGIEVVAEQPADSDKAKAMSVMENILQNHNDIKAVFCGNDDMAIGALRAIKAAGLDIMVVGVDGTEEAIKSILDGGLFGSIAQKPYDMGYLGVENAVKAIKGEKIEERIDSGLDVITKENAQEKLEFLQSLTK